MVRGERSLARLLGREAVSLRAQHEKKVCFYDFFRLHHPALPPLPALLPHPFFQVLTLVFPVSSSQRLHLRGKLTCLCPAQPPPTVLHDYRFIYVFRKL